MAAFSEIGNYTRKDLHCVKFFLPGAVMISEMDLGDVTAMLLASDDLFFHVWNDCGPSPSKTFCGWFSPIVLEMEVLSPLHRRLKFAELC